MSSRQAKKRTYAEALSPDLEVPAKKRCIREATESPESTARQAKKRTYAEALSPDLEVPAKKRCIREATESPESTARQAKKRTYAEALSPDLEVPAKKRCIREATESPESTAREIRKRMNTEALSPTLDMPATKRCIEEASEGPEDSGRSETAAAASTDFYQLLEDPQIGQGLAVDSCKKLTDKYLLAMVKVYFQRAKLQEEEYNTFNFFAALFLANEMEEETNFHNLIYHWGLGNEFLVKWQEMRSKKLELWERMGFKAWVSKSSCEEAMEDNPTHWAWRRKRHHNHGLAIRLHARQRDYFYFNVPNISPAICSQCAPKPPLPKKSPARQGAAIQEEDVEKAPLSSFFSV